MKTVTVSAAFDGIEVGSLTSTKTASNFGAAVGASIRAILKNAILKNKRIKTVTFSAQIVEA